MRPPLTFTTPSLINDTDKARAKAERDFKEIVREADRYFGPDKVDQLVHDTRKGRQGNTPDAERNALILGEWDSALAKGWSKNKFAHEYAKEHGEEFEAVRRQLKRLLDTKERQVKEQARRDAWQRSFQQTVQRFGKSFLGTDGTK